MQSGQQHTDSRLISRLAANDAEAFTEIYVTYHPVMLEYAIRLLKLKPVAEDVCNEILLALWQKRQDLKSIQSLKAYLLTAARNRSINALKDLARSQAAMKDLQKSFEQKSIHCADQHLDKEYIAFIKKEVEKLPPRARQVFTLCREEGYSYEDVSSRLGISRNAVKSHMVYSIKKLKALSKKDLGISFLLLFLLVLRF